MITLLLGAQWGDEGKGKLTDVLLGSGYDICARAGGGRNAGHSVKAGGKTIHFHLLPSGLASPNVDNILGSGVVFSPEAFFEELEELQKQGVPRIHERIFVSDRAHLNLTLHASVDGLAEAELGQGKIGTTKKGIGPTYSTKASRDGLRVIDIYHESFENKLRKLADGYRKRYGDLLQYSVEDEIQKYRKYKEDLRPYVVDALVYMQKAQASEKSILVEGSQGLMLDLDVGTYPFTTATSCSVGGCIQGLALSPFNIKEIIGVVKVYTTRVGDGPFPTEDHGEIGEKLQDIGGEYGVTTGRRRRCGWLDLVVLQHSNHTNHYTTINLTKLDVLDSFPTIRVGVAYKTPQGERLTSFPANLSLLENCTVEYQDFPGWQSSTKGVRSWSELPPAAQKYIEFIEASLGVKIGYIGTGPDRQDMIFRD